jgi:nitrogen fixation NifU-like protein
LSETQFEVILDHYRNPRNYGSLEDASVKVKDSNPLCGDVIENLP